MWSVPFSPDHLPPQIFSDASLRRYTLRNVVWHCQIAFCSGLAPYFDNSRKQSHVHHLQRPMWQPKSRHPRLWKIPEFCKTLNCCLPARPYWSDCRYGSDTDCQLEAYVRFEVLTAVMTMTLLSWVLTPCKPVDRYQRHIFSHEDDDAMFLRNVGIYLQVYKSTRRHNPEQRRKFKDLYKVFFLLQLYNLYLQIINT